jgi:hypothetical protein
VSCSTIRLHYPRTRGVITWASSATLLVMVQRNPDAGQEIPDHKNDWSWWKDNSTVIIAILSVAVVAIRLLGVARGDPEIAFAILQIGGTGTVLIATLVSTLGLLAIPVCAVFIYNTWENRKNATKFLVLTACSFGMLTIALYMAPAFLLAISIPLLILAVILSLGTLSTGPQTLTGFIALYVFGLFIFGLFSPTPWLPVQEIHAAGQGPFTGYVLSQDNGETSILTANPEGVISISSQKILATEQCTPPYYLWEQATIFEFISGWQSKLTTYPSCPSARYSQSSPSATPTSATPTSATPTSATPTSATPSPYPAGRA